MVMSRRAVLRFALMGLAAAACAGPAEALPILPEGVEMTPVAWWPWGGWPAWRRRWRWPGWGGWGRWNGWGRNGFRRRQFCYWHPRAC